MRSSILRHAVHQAISIVQPARLIAQLLDVHRNLAFSNTSSDAQAGRMYGRGIHQDPPQVDCSTAPFDAEVERIQEQFCGSFQGDWITALPGFSLRAKFPS
jgi:hypothetical protein